MVERELVIPQELPQGLLSPSLVCLGVACLSQSIYLNLSWLLWDPGWSPYLRDILPGRVSGMGFRPTAVFGPKVINDLQYLPPCNGLNYVPY